MRETGESVPGLKWLSRILRILIILIALYLEWFSLDVFKSGFPFWKTVLAFILHSLPSLALFFVLYISLKWEQIAGFTLIFFALMGTLPAGPPDDRNLFIYIILGSMTIVGILYVLNYFVFGKRKNGDNY